MPGCAITEVEIDGVQHEYSAIEGIQEDVIEILLNLKNVAIVMHGKDHTVVTLSKKGPGIVTAGDITVDQNVEIKNPDLLIAHITGDVALNMRLTITSLLTLVKAPMTKLELSVVCILMPPTAQYAVWLIRLKVRALSNVRIWINWLSI
jgi:DNA-directed RNA polymerase alpha subunit